MGQLTRRGLRAACLEICRDKYDNTDAPLLRTFFEGGNDKAAFIQAIARHPVDKFRPLAKFLKEGNNPDDKVVELAAWLVGFKPRPYDPTVDYTKISEISSGRANSQTISVSGKIPPDEDHKTVDLGDSTSSESEKGREKKRRFILIISITVAFAMTISLVWLNKPPAPVYIGRQACMYWNEDHYEPISCRQHGDTLVVALDTFKLAHFRKITRPDTITTNAMGSVWYVRYRKDYEFYTADGVHPIDPNLRLRPITEFIIRNHIHPQP